MCITLPQDQGGGRKGARGRGLTPRGTKSPGSQGHLQGLGLVPGGRRRFSPSGTPLLGLESPSLIPSTPGSLTSLLGPAWEHTWWYGQTFESTPSPSPAFPSPSGLRAALPITPSVQEKNT